MTATAPNDAPPAVLALTPLLVSGATAGRLCGISGRTWHRLDLAGRVPQAIQVGRLKRWAVAELVEWAGAGCPARDRFQSIKDNARGVGGTGRAASRLPHDTRFAPRMARGAAG